MHARRAAFRALVALEKGRVRRLALAGRDRIACRDRDLAVELARGTERLRLLLDRLLAPLTERGPPEDPYLRVALRLGAYQLLFLERVPPHAAVAETAALVERGRGFVNAVLRRVAAAVVDRPANPERPRHELGLPGGRAFAGPTAWLPDPELEPAAHLAVRHGLPEFLVSRWLEAFGPEAADAAAAAATRVPGLTLRPNRLRVDLEELRARLAREGSPTEPAEHPGMLRWTGEGLSPVALPAFREGLFVVQDPTALRAAEAVAARPGERILDLCAAPGGKTSALAEAVGPEGRVYAHEVDPRRRRTLAETVARLGLEGIVEIVSEPTRAPFDVDAVLVDAPCSNTGVLARRVEVRRWLRPESFARCAATQARLLGEALQRVRPGGRVVYATCSLELEENEQLVRSVLEGRRAVMLEEESRTWPSPPRHDGGYHARLRRPD